MDSQLTTLLEKKSGKFSLGNFSPSGEEKLFKIELNVGLPFMWGIFSHMEGSGFLLCMKVNFSSPKGKLFPELLPSTCFVQDSKVVRSNPGGNILHSLAQLSVHRE